MAVRGTQVRPASCPSLRHEHSGDMQLTFMLLWHATELCTIIEVSHRHPRVGPPPRLQIVTFLYKLPFFITREKLDQVIKN